MMLLACSEALLVGKGFPVRYYGYVHVLSENSLV